MRRKTRKIEPEEDELQKWLKPFRESEQPVSHVLLTKTLLQMASDWTRSEPIWIRPDAPPPLEVDGLYGRRALWDYLWSGVEFDWEEVARLAGLPSWIAKDHLWTLVMRRLIYPDGTVTVPMQEILGTAKKALEPEPGQHDPANDPFEKALQARFKEKKPEKPHKFVPLLVPRRKKPPTTA